ncbi:hypothetical protein Acr_17g0001440 [Actinidia rufa]|uniref:Uncharacterized protein n=1 Tax=Actinidia rufa TaxID=165716 RepID=A0A7J0G1B4_9ERIC|nr:hypothetical protein Acr_17g0001440 [Actinidia rufa]
MAPPAELVKIGFEGFGLLEEAMRLKKRTPPNQTQLRHQAPPEKDTMDCFQAAKKFGGIVIVNIPANMKAPPIRRQLF